jgi:hypothetical protein
MERNAVPESHKEETERHPQRAWAVQSWLGSETLESLAELNDQCLEVLREEAKRCCTRTGHPLLADLRDLWGDLDVSARRRAAWCPYLLVDLGFIEANRWAWVRGHHVRDEKPSSMQPPFFTPQLTLSIRRQVLTYAWHLARSQSSAARMLLGMSSQCAELIAACTLRQVTEIAENHPDWLQPRWSGHLRVWRELLTTAISGETEALEHARMRGLQLLAAEARYGGYLLPPPFG